MEETPVRLGDILIEAGVITPEQLDRALELQKNRQLRLGTILLQEGIVSEPQLVQALGRRLSIPWVSLWHLDIDDALLELVPVSVAEEFFLIPIYIRTTGQGERSLYVAMNDPMDNSALRFVAASAGMTVKPMIAAPSDISAAIRLYYYGEEAVSEEPPPPIPPSSGGSISALPPPVTKAHSKPVPPPPKADPSRDSNKPPPPPGEVVKDIEELLADDVEEDVIEPDDIEELPEDEVTEGDVDEKDVEETENEPEESSEEESEEATEEEPEEDASEEASDDQEPDSEKTEEEKQLSQREIEKHLFGVGGGAKPKGISLTLLDGTTIAFGGASKKSTKKQALTKQDLIAGLRASAEGTPIEGFLPSTKWEDYIAAILEVLFKKHLVLFDEFMDTINKNKPSE